MDEVPWYAEASLSGPGRVYRAGSLAQCVRRWARLTDEEKTTAQIQLKKAIDGRTIFEKGHIAALAASPDLKRV
jgi:hypothetical protein